ncbi:hypothetical protein LX32DRAFT_9225 [Colletotrichum zoysiae]|uniref:Uncharacterized protein n=1 Tax=Colletotrichum zoysiae TaxID=1216348 RepID=A0AAD9LY74_9PEZI|nr:hypothetical protein LX32DRAFT_9225 [Colletotrichum zoysiae]
MGRVHAAKRKEKKIPGLGVCVCMYVCVQAKANSNLRRPRPKPQPTLRCLLPFSSEPFRQGITKSTSDLASPPLRPPSLPTTESQLRLILSRPGSTVPQNEKTNNDDDDDDKMASLATVARLSARVVGRRIPAESTARGGR